MATAAGYCLPSAVVRLEYMYEKGPSVIADVSGAVSRVVVAVPARNEAARIVRTLSSIRIAADAAPAGVDVQIVVAADSCHDATVELVRDVARCDRRVAVVEGTWRSAGGARRSAVDGAFADLRAHERRCDDELLRRSWIATTDADTAVPPNWLTLQLASAAEGIDAIAGVVELHRDADWTAEVARVFDEMYDVHATSHPHVHGANLGFRASAYMAVGGFSDVAVAEDHLVWDALRSGGYACVSSTALRVSTSARRAGRAHGGFADTLRARVAAVERAAMAIPGLTLGAAT